MFQTTIIILILFLTVIQAALTTREEKLKDIPKKYIYDVMESNFDTLINWTPLVLVCFYDPS